MLAVAGQDHGARVAQAGQRRGHFGAWRALFWCLPRRSRRMKSVRADEGEAPAGCVQPQCGCRTGSLTGAAWRCAITNGADRRRFPGRAGELSGARAGQKAGAHPGPSPRCRALIGRPSPAGASNALAVPSACESRRAERARLLLPIHACDMVGLCWGGRRRGVREAQVLHLSLALGRGNFNTHLGKMHSAAAVGCQIVVLLHYADAHSRLPSNVSSVCW